MLKDAWLQLNVDRKETVVSMAKPASQMKRAVAIPVTARSKVCVDSMEPNAFPQMKDAQRPKDVKNKVTARIFPVPKIGRHRTGGVKKMRKGVSNLNFVQSMDNVDLQTVHVLQRSWDAPIRKFVKKMGFVSTKNTSAVLNSIVPFNCRRVV